MATGVNGCGGLFHDMARVHTVDEAMLKRTLDYLRVRARGQPGARADLSSASDHARHRVGRWGVGPLVLSAGPEELGRRTDTRGCRARRVATTC